MPFALIAFAADNISSYDFGIPTLALSSISLR